VPPLVGSGQLEWHVLGGLVALEMDTGAPHRH
jgi:hypothetical protein